MHKGYYFPDRFEWIRRIPFKSHLSLRCVTVLSISVSLSLFLCFPPFLPPFTFPSLRSTIFSLFISSLRLPIYSPRLYVLSRTLYFFAIFSAFSGILLDPHLFIPRWNMVTAYREGNFRARESQSELIKLE